jgi:hypothetical protein
MQTQNLKEQTKDFKKKVIELILYGYAEFDIDLSKDDFIRCMEPMKQITATNPGLKFCTDPDSKEHDRALFYRSKNQGKDDKWCFHGYPNIEAELNKKLGEGEWPNELVCLLNNSKKVYNAFQAKSSEIVKAIDSLMPEFGLYNLYMEPRSQAIQVARFAAYDEAKEKFTVAGRHFDQSFITLSGYQSHSGLYLIDQSGNIINLEYHEGKVWVFFGRKAPILTAGKLTASEHGVDVFEKDIQRDAVPFFGHIYIPKN